MKKPIENTKIKALRAKSVRTRLNESEWNQVDQTVPPDQRIRVNVDLELSPLQHRALLWMCKMLSATPSQLATSAIVGDLDGHNQAEEEVWLWGTISSMLAQFPERENDLAKLRDAYGAQADGVRGARWSSDAQTSETLAQGAGKAS